MSKDFINSIINDFTKKWNNKLQGFWADDGNNFGSIRGRWYNGQYQEALDPFAEEIQRLLKIKQNLEQELQELRQVLVEKKEPLQPQEPKEKWDWDKFWVGLSKSQIIQKILIYCFAFLLLVVSQKYPEYEPILWFLAASMGIGGEITALQNNFIRMKKH
jgi:hypothetical protein